MLFETLHDAQELTGISQAKGVRRLARHRRDSGRGRLLDADQTRQQDILAKSRTHPPPWSSVLQRGALIRNAQSLATKAAIALRLTSTSELDGTSKETGVQAVVNNCTTFVTPELGQVAADLAAFAKTPEGVST